MSGAELEQKFWSELEKSPFVMLGLQGIEDSRTRPMAGESLGPAHSARKPVVHLQLKWRYYT